MEEENKKRSASDIDRIEALQKKLYSRNSPNIMNEERHKFEGKPLQVKENWEHEKEAPIKKSVPKINSNKMPFLKKSLIFSVIFFVLACLVAVFIFFGGFNFISSKKVGIEISGPSSVNGGEKLVLDISVSNDNRATLEDLVLTVEYPEGTKDPEDPLKNISRQQKFIDFLDSGKTSSETFSAIIYGEKNSVKNVRFILEYKTRGSSAIFSKEEIYEFGIESTPVSVMVNFPKEVATGQEVEFEITVVSNLLTPLADLILVADYPFGFEPSKSTSQSVSSDGKVFALGNLPAGGEEKVFIKGIINGQENEGKVFKFKVGSESLSEKGSIDLELASSIETLNIRKSFMSLDIDINRTLVGDYVTQMGSNFRVKVDWTSNLPGDLNDAIFEAKINGKSVDKLSISAEQGGFYKSQENIIIWDKNTTPEMSRIRPGQKGSLEFVVGTLNPGIESVDLFLNSEIDIEIVVKGVRFYESEPPESVATSVLRKVKIATDLALSARSVYSIGPFMNSGPIPPKAEQPTTYSIIWSVSSNWNDAEDVSVTATLPIYVDWQGKVSPSGEKVSFNEDTRIISWKAGKILAGTGFSSSPREIVFQISFTPSFGQVGSTPILVGEPSIIGTDTFTLTDVSDKKPALTTRITTDPIYQHGMERVGQ